MHTMHLPVRIVRYCECILLQIYIMIRYTCTIHPHIAQIHFFFNYHITYYIRVGYHNRPPIHRNYYEYTPFGISATSNPISGLAGQQKCRMHSTTSRKWGTSTVLLLGTSTSATSYPISGLAGQQKCRMHSTVADNGVQVLCYY